MVIFVISCGSIDDEKYFKSAHKGRSGSGLTAEVGHYAGHNHLRNPLFVQSIFKRCLVEGIILALAQHISLGEIKIRELRALAEKELGDMFDVREFHDAILLNGSLPLDVLENKVKEWIG